MEWLRIRKFFYVRTSSLYMRCRDQGHLVMLVQKVGTAPIFLGRNCVLKVYVNFHRRCGMGKAKNVASGEGERKQP